MITNKNEQLLLTVTKNKNGEININTYYNDSTYEKFDVIKVIPDIIGELQKYLDENTY